MKAHYSVESTLGYAGSFLKQFGRLRVGDIVWVLPASYKNFRASK